MDAGEGGNVRVQKVRKIFQRFDANGDGRLNRQEMAALVIAVNPRVKFSEEQIGAILDEVFRTYSDYIQGDGGLSFEGLLRTYDDGAGDVDRDFDALRLRLDDSDTAATNPASSSITDERERTDTVPLSRRKQNAPPWALSPNNGIVYDNTWRLVEDLQIIIRRLETKYAAKRKDNGLGGATDASSELAWSRDFGLGGGSIGSDGEIARRIWEELGQDYVTFRRELGEIQAKADRSSTPDEVFDAYMGIGRTLFDHALYVEALSCFKKASDKKPTDPRPHFRLGNTLYVLGQYPEARDCFISALDSAGMSQNRYDFLLPYIHVNLGVALEADGMLLNASEHYKEAAIRDPKNFKALKLLGGALYGVGEYRAAEKALMEAIFLKNDYADAHCDLGSTLHAMGDDERAIHEFQKAIDIKPDHVDALYNLGGLFRDIGRFQRAAEMYSRVLTQQPGHWRAQLNRAVALLGAGENEEARKAFKEALKLTNRIELYDALRQLKRLERKKSVSTNVGEKSTPALQNSGSHAEEEGSLVIEATRFRQVSGKTTPRQWLTHALDIRHFQRHTRLYRCSVTNVKREFSERQLPLLSSGDGATGKFIRKEELEKIMRRLLFYVKPETFQGAVKAINGRILCVLDSAVSGRVDVGMFLATIAPICAGSQDTRKRVAFDALVWRAPKEVGAISKGDALQYFRCLRAVYLPSQGGSASLEVHPNDADMKSLTLLEG
ncbi:hypothetical protein KP509_33G059500 [Ceratopteris richardii]|uniref:EF-hand domain-containing protein n=1 Tax=Ceratopteris richardii TaxID=49495 RepID=A0A8T2QQK5_CERRI|nr:hypothetical protein KP509_33G059500 [Ceratopteris richardii]